MEQDKENKKRKNRILKKLVLGVMLPSITVGGLSGFVIGRTLSPMQFEENLFQDHYFWLLKSKIERMTEMYDGEQGMSETDEMRLQEAIERYNTRSENERLDGINYTTDYWENIIADYEKE
tara:strand:- start:111 stop:473 length:363 start_codon:yes stop_codon:yes gene_type:complete